MPFITPPERASSGPAVPARSTRTQRLTENGSLRSKSATFLPASMKLSPTSCCASPTLPGTVFVGRSMSPTRPRSLASTTLASTRIGLGGFLTAGGFTGGFGFFGSTFGGSITGRGVSNGKWAMRPGGCATAARAASAAVASQRAKPAS